MAKDISDEMILRGGKGSGGGGMKEDANTLRANTKFKILDLLSEGETGGLVDGAKSIYLNETPLQNADGSWNFQGIKYTERVGLPDQEVIPGFEFATQEVPVGVEVKANVPISRTINAANLEAIRVKVGIPALQFVDQKNSRITRTSVTYRFQLIDGMNVVKFDQIYTISGKTSSEYQREHYIKLPGNGTYIIRMTRLTADATTQDLANTTVFAGYTEVNEDKFSYPDSALIGIEIDAQQFGDNVPSRAYRTRGILCKVPSNYDPVNHKYTGLWNGQFKRAATDDPAWILYDLLTNDRYGLGEVVPEGSVDRLALYQISRYCNQQVPNGLGGMEPRFTFNAWIVNQQEAHEALSILSSAFRGMIYWKTGSITAVQDSPEDPLVDVNNTQVIDGIFSYEKTAKKARATVVYVSWTDPNDFYKTAVDVVEDFEGVARLGWQRRDITLVGCYSRSMAIRMARWILYTEQSEDETVKYNCYADHLRVAPGKILKINDSKRLGWRMGGRIKAVNSPTQIVLDSEYEFTAGSTYNVTVIKADGSPEEIRVVNPGTKASVINLERAPELAQQASWPWSILSNDPNYWSVRLSGQIETVNSGTSIKLPEPFSFQAGSSYRVSLIGADGVTQHIPIQNPAVSTDTISLNYAPAVAQVAGSSFAISVNDASKSLYRTVLVREVTDDPNVITYEVSGVAHNPNKFAEIDLQMRFPEPSRYNNVQVHKVPAIQSMTAQEVQEVTPVSARRHMTLTWTAPFSDKVNPTDPDEVYPFIRAYQVFLNLNDGGFELVGETDVPEFTVQDIGPGDYKVWVKVVNTWGFVSRPFQGSFSLDQLAVGGPAISGLELVGGVSPSEFVGKDANFSWRKSSAALSYELDDEPNGADSGSMDPYFKDYQVQIINGQDKVIRTEFVLDPSYSYTYEKNYADNNGSPLREFIVAVRYRDRGNGLGIPSALKVRNSVPEIPTVEFEATYETIILQYSKPLEPDFAGLRVWASETPGVTTQDSLIVHDGPGAPTFTFPSGTTVYIKYAAFDDFGKTGLKISEEMVINTKSVGVGEIDTTPPSSPPKPTVSSETTIQAGGVPQTTLIVTWTANVEPDMGEYEVELTKEGGVPKVESAGTNRKEWIVSANSTYEVRVLAKDRVGNRSQWSPKETHTTVVDAVAPGTPEKPSVVALFASVSIVWTSPTDEDLRAVQVWEGTTSDPAQATLVTEVSSRPGVVGSYVRATPGYGSHRYFLRAVDTSGNFSGFSPASDAVTANGIQVPDFASDVVPIQNVDALPSSGNKFGDNVRLRSDGKLYTWTSQTETEGTSFWSKTVASTDISGLLTSDQIASLNANKLNGKIVGTQISDGAITTPLLGANVVTASKLYVGDTSNMFPDPEMVDEASYTGAPFTIHPTSPESGYSSRNYLRVEAAAGDQFLYNSETIPVERDKPYYFSAVAFTETNAFAMVFVDWYGQYTNGDLYFLSNSTVTQSTNPSGRGAQMLYPPAGARRVRFSMYRQGGGTGAAGFAEMICRRAINGELVVDGSIKTQHISTDKLDANILKAGSIRAAQIGAQEVTVDKLAVTSTENLVPNGFLEGDTVGARPQAWSRFTASGDNDILVLESSAWPSLRAVRLRRWTANSGELSVVADKVHFNGGATAFQKGGFLANPGDEFYVECWAHQSHSGALVFDVVGINTDGSLNIPVQAYSQNSQTSGNGSNSSAGITPVNTWVKVQFSFKHNGSNGSTVKLFLRIFNANSGVGSEVFVGGLVVRRRNAGLLVVDGTLESRHIKVQSLTGDRLQAGTIQGTHIAAKTLTSAHVAIGDTDNVVDNGWSEGKQDGWSFYGQVGWYVETGNALANGWQFQSNTRDQAWSKFVNVKPGDQYYLEATVHQFHPNTANIYVAYYPNAHNEDGRRIDHVVGTTVKNTFVVIGKAITIPAGYSRFRMLLQCERNDTGGNQYTYWSKPLARRMAAGKLIVDGDVEARHIKANNITSDHLQSNSVLSQHIQSNTITARHLTITPGNMNPDPLFLDENYWRLDSNGWFFDLNSGNNQPSIIGVSKSISMWEGYAAPLGRRHVVGPRTKGITGGRVYSVRAKGNNGSNQRIYAQASFFRATDGAHLGQAMVYWDPGQTGLKEAQAVAPAGADTYEIIYYTEGNVTFSGVCTLADLQLFEAASASMIVDGSIQAQKLSVSQLSAVSSNLGSINAGSMNINGRLVMGSDGNLQIRSGDKGIIMGSGLGVNQDLVMFAGIRKDNLSQLTKADAAFWLDQNGNGGFSGIVSGSLLSASALELGSTRIHCGAGRLAPFVITEIANARSANNNTPGDLTATISGFVSPDNGSGYNNKRLARHKMDILIEAFVHGDYYMNYVYIDVMFHNDGNWMNQGSASGEMGGRASQQIALRYTSYDSSPWPWSQMAIRARTTGNSTLSLLLKVTIMNFNESANAQHTSSGINTGGGAGGTPPPSTGGGGGDPYCVDYETTVLPDGRWVRDLKVGDTVQAWDENPENPGIEEVGVVQVRFGEEESFVLTTEGGASVIQSRSTPMVLRNGNVAYTPDMLGEQVLVNRHGVLTWEEVTSLVNVGVRKVVKASMQDSMYFAGVDAEATIATHNIRYKPTNPTYELP